IVSRGRSPKASTEIIPLYHRFDGRPAETAVAANSDGGQLATGGVLVHRAHWDLQMLGDLRRGHHILCSHRRRRRSRCRCAHVVLSRVEASSRDCSTIPSRVEEGADQTFRCDPCTSRPPTTRAESLGWGERFAKIDRMSYKADRGEHTSA